MALGRLVARICSELDYVPDALPDYQSRRHYKGQNWRRGEYRPPTSIAPEERFCSKTGEQRRTVLLEYERQATKGGQALTRKLMVWINYALYGTKVYQGEEVVAFVVSTEASRDLLAERYRLLVRNTLGFSCNRQCISSWRPRRRSRRQRRRWVASGRTRTTRRVEKFHWT